MKVYCPYCRKEVEYKIEKRDVKKFRGIDIDTYENVAVCKECNNDLYVNEIENKNNMRKYEIYRKEADIITPQSIIDLRKKYNISQRELTSILGYGKMTINRYEKGGLPTKAQSDYLKMLIKDEGAFIEKAKEALKKGNINEKTYKKINLKEQEESDENNKIQDNIRKYLNMVLNKEPNIYNGYKELDLEKIENIISYIASNVSNLTITSLNKYLWFIDMLSFNKRGIAITGLTYQKQKFGPTIISKKYDELSLLSDKYIREDIETKEGNTTKIISKDNFDLKELNENEIAIINEIIKLLKNKKVTEISELSHKEEGWTKTKKLEKISFEYAMNLNIGK